MSDTTLMHDPERLCPECLQATKHDQDAYWLRTMATAAMQGILSCPPCPYTAHEIAINAVDLAERLLKAIKESEGEG